MTVDKVLHVCSTAEERQSQFPLRCSPSYSTTCIWWTWQVWQLVQIQRGPTELQTCLLAKGTEFDWIYIVFPSWKNIWCLGIEFRNNCALWYNEYCSIIQQSDYIKSTQNPSLCCIWKPSESSELCCGSKEHWPHIPHQSKHQAGYITWQNCSPGSSSGRQKLEWETIYKNSKTYKRRCVIENWMSKDFSRYWSKLGCLPKVSPTMCCQV